MKTRIYAAPAVKGLNPHDASKHVFCISEEWFDFLNLGVLEQKKSCNCFNIIISFFTNFKSSSSTTSLDCDSNSWFVSVEDGNGNSMLESVETLETLRPLFRSSY